MNKKIGILVGVIIAGMIGGAAILNGDKNEKKADVSRETIVVEDRNGNVEVPLNPDKVVVLDYSSLDTMKMLDEEAIAVPKSNLPKYLEEYNDEKYQDLGSLKKFDIEKINEFTPDLIIIEGRQGDFYDELSKIAPTLLLGSDGSNHIEALEKNVDILGKIFEKEESAKEKISDINTRFSNIKKLVSERGSNALLMMIDSGEMNVFGKGSRFGIIYDDFGFEVADQNIAIANHGQNITSEYILKVNPDYLFVVDKALVASGVDTPDKKAVENELIQKIEAFKNGNIIYLDTKSWYTGGPGIYATQNMISEIESIIN